MSYGGRPPRAVPDPTQKAMELLVRREHSRRDLKRKLRPARRGPPDEAEAAVEKLAALGYQDDDRFAASFARDRRQRRLWSGAHPPELAGHGLGRDQVEAALDACETDWAGLARALVDKRVPPASSWPTRRQRRKAVDFLLRRGFDQNCTYAAVRARPDEDFDAA